MGFLAAGRWGVSVAAEDGFFFFFFGLSEQIWWWLEFVGCGGCLCLDKFGVGLNGSGALIPS